MGKDGKAIKDKNAYANADIERMSGLIRLFNSAGFSTIYTGEQSKFGLKGGESAQSIHKNHIHFGRGRINTVR